MAELIEWLIAGRSSGGGCAAVVAMVAAAVVTAVSTATATTAMDVHLFIMVSLRMKHALHIYTQLFLCCFNIIDNINESESSIYFLQRYFCITLVLFVTPSFVNVEWLECLQCEHELAKQNK